VNGRADSITDTARWPAAEGRRAGAREEERRNASPQPGAHCLL